MPPTKWYHTALIGGGAAAGLSVLLYYLLKEEKKSGKNSEQGIANFGHGPESGSHKFDIRTATIEQVQSILEAILESQENMKNLVKQLTREVFDKDYTFDEIYTSIRKVLPEDPLEKSGMSMLDFDHLLEKFDSDQTIQALVSKIMIPGTPDKLMEEAALISVETIVSIHLYMLENLKKLKATFKAIPNHESYDMKSVTIVIQIMSSIEIEKKFNVNMELVEVATLLRHDKLSTDADFAFASCEMQNVMSEIFGNNLQPPMT